MVRCLTGWRPVRVSGAVNPCGPKKPSGVFTARCFCAIHLCSLLWFSCMVWNCNSIRFVRCGLSLAWWWRDWGGSARGNAVGGVWAWSSGRRWPVLPAPVTVIRPLPGSGSLILLAAKVRPEYVINEKVSGPVSWMQCRLHLRRRWRPQAQGQRRTVCFSRVRTVRIFHDWCLPSFFAFQ